MAEEATKEVASRAALALSIAYQSFTFSLTIDNVWLAGALGLGTLGLGTIGIGAYYLANKRRCEEAIRNALQRNNEDAGADPEVRNIRDGHSILVDLCCHSEQSFLSFVDDFKAGLTKLKVNEQFRNIGFDEELKVTINNLEDMYKQLYNIR